MLGSNIEKYPGIWSRATKRCVVHALCAVVLAASIGVAATAQDKTVPEEIVLTVGHSTVVRAPWPAIRVAITDPKIADVQALTPEQTLVQGLAIGSTDLIMWSEGEKQTVQKRIVVRLDLESLQSSLKKLFPTAQLQVSASGEVVVIQGLLRSAGDAEQLKDYLDKSKISYVNMTNLAGIQQVQLQVRLAEVSRAAIRALGVNGLQTRDDFFFGQRIGSSDGGSLIPSLNIGPTGSQEVGNNLSFSTPEDGIGVSSAVTLFAGFPNSDLQVFLQALAENQYVRILANPTLVSLSGEEAQFLAGGEFPIPVPQGGGSGLGTTTITVDYKEFGVRLKFRPVVLGDGGIRLHAAQEVSELTDVGSVAIQGFTIPALTTRRAETTLELKNGQSFAMAGLLQHTNSAINSRIPGLGDLPIIGSLFRSVRYKNNETELVILVTASLVEPMSAGQVPPLPGVAHARPSDWELYVDGRLEGREPAQLDEASRDWLQQMGLHELVGPGAWDSYGQ